MASTPTTTAAPDATDHLIRGRIEGARRFVKLVELFAALMLLLAGTMVYFLLAVLVDHWVVSLSPGVRFLTLAAYLVGAAAFSWIYIAQLVFRRINPLYAARALEHNAPSLKNSVINFLFFRDHQSRLQPAVFATLQQRAAADLSAPNVDTTIDASKAIRIGYLLIAVLIVSAVYTIAAPKSAFQSIGRVMNPWWQAAAPARVQIDFVEPGDVSVYYGDRVVVRAAVSGKRESDKVVVVYSTADRQTVDVELPMLPTDDGLYFEATLPPDENGVHQDLTYRVLAGDAKSNLYQVKTNAAPSMVVDQVVYRFPKYADLPDRTEQRQGDIRGLAGARVTIHARANRDIRSARVEFDPVDGKATATMPMKVDGRKATFTFDLELNAKNQSTRKAYQLRFLDDQGKRNPQPILHVIDVTRDFPPVVEILTPDARRIEVPIDGKQQIEIRAVDPDFSLEKIGLNMVVGETEVFGETRQRAQRGQVVERFEFSPQRLKLSVGDTVTYRGFAEDNRTDFDGQPRPNTEVTPRYTIVITEPTKKPTPDTSKTGDEGDPNQKKPGEDADNESKDAENKDAEKKDNESKDGEGKDGEGKDGEGKDGNAKNAKPGDKPGDNKDPDKNNDGEKSGDKKSGEGDADGNAGEMKPGEGDPEGGAEQGASSGSEPSQGGKPEGKADAQGSATGGEPKPDGSQGENGVGDHGSAAEGGQGGPSKPGQGDADLSNAEPNEAFEDGDAIETIKEHIDRSKGTRTGETQRSENQADPGRAENKTKGKPSGDESNQLNKSDPDLPESSTDGNDPKSPGDGETKQQKGSPSSQNPGGSTGGEDKTQSGDNTASDKPGAGAQEGENPKPGDPKKDGDQGQNGNLGAGKKIDANDGENGATNKAQKQASDEDANKTTDSESGMGDSGESGAGQKKDSPMGAANQQGANQDRKKNQRPDGGKDDTGSDPQAPANSPKQSDTQGDQGGDRSGGGKQGGGQSAKQAGNDSAGSQSSADEGAGASSESGQGDTSGAAGSKQQADDATGSSGDKNGDGSQTQSGSEGGPEGDSPNASRNQNLKPNGQSGSGRPQGGGVAPEGKRPNGRQPVQEVADGDAANEEYARKATDMALDYLKHNPDDQALMDKLNWTDKDRQRFLERWGKLKKSASEGDEGKRQLSDAFQGLGLRRGSETMDRQNASSDDAGGLSQEGASPANLPAHLLERFNAYKRGAAKSRK